MPPFPYLDIVKKAYELTLKNRWLWVFGLFVGGTTGLNFGGINYLIPVKPQTIPNPKLLFQAWTTWIASHPQIFSLLVGVALLVLVGLIFLSGLSRGAVVWAIPKLSEEAEGKITTEPVGFRQAFRQGRKYAWQIIGLQVFTTLIFFLLLSIFGVPIIYMFAAGAVGKALILTIIGAVIFLPAILIFSFIHIYGPIFIVLYHARIGDAIQHAFNLIWQKLKESVLLAAFLAGLSILFIFLLVFSIILLSIPIFILAILLIKLGFVAGVYALLIVAAALSVAYTVLLGAAFAVFQNIAWVLAVMHMVKTGKLNEEEKVLAAEPVG
jgi:hypothetical protein